MSLPTTTLSLRDKLIGAWELVRFSAYSVDDHSNIVYPLGADAQGLILYTPDGYMSAQLQRSAASSVSNPGASEDWEKAAPYYTAYTGRFFVNEEGDEHGPILIHEMRNSNTPKLVGQRQRRLFQVKDEVDGKYLEITIIGSMDIEGVRRVPILKWKRMVANHGIQEPN